MLGAWSVRCVGWADWVDFRCFLSFVFIGDARLLELSPCNILPRPTVKPAASRFFASEHLDMHTLSSCYSFTGGLLRKAAALWRCLKHVLAA